MFLKIFFPNVEVTRRIEIIKRKQCSNQVIDFTDAAEREKRNQFKDSHFVIGIDISNKKKKISVCTQSLADPRVPMIVFHLKFEE